MLQGLSKIRIRLTLWYVGIFGAILFAFICVTSVLHYLHLQDQLYHEEIQDMETVEGLLYFGPDGRLLLKQDYFISEEHRMLLDRLLEVLSADGAVLFRNNRLGTKTLGGPRSDDEGSTEFYRHSLRLPDGTHVLVLSHVRPIEGKTVLLRIGYSTEPIRRQSIQLFGLLMLVMPFALFVAGAAGAKVAAKALDPLKQMAELTEDITAHRLSERVPVRNADDELGHMARVLNDLLERLQTSFQQLQRFTSDVSHELRTPLASIRSIGEVGAQADYDSVQYRDMIGSMLEEVSRLTSMIDTLLTIAHAESGSIALDRSRFSATQLVRESVSIVKVLAEDKAQIISIMSTDDGQLSADRAFLRMAVVNLLDNAVKYSPESSEIYVTVRLLTAATSEGHHLEIGVADSGPGIPEGARERVFDRFYRVDDSRSRDAGGVGLGLAIAKWAVEAHGGSIRVETADGGGSNFLILLPAVSNNCETSDSRIS
ncbi:MAG: ATP-binding protein [Acidobacteriota bacterium]